MLRFFIIFFRSMRFCSSLVLALQKQRFIGWIMVLELCLRYALLSFLFCIIFALICVNTFFAIFMILFGPHMVLIAKSNPCWSFIISRWSNFLSVNCNHWLCCNLISIDMLSMSWPFIKWFKLFIVAYQFFFWCWYLMLCMLISKF